MSQLCIQDSRTVAYRALCLGTLLKRREWELAVQNSGERFIFDGVRDHVLQQYQQFNADLLKWLAAEKIMPHLSKSEQRILNQPFATWSERTLTCIGWRIEALGILLWALKRVDTIPAYDDQFILKALLEPLDLLNPTIDFIWLASLRPAEELQIARDCAEQWNWRSRATELERMGVRPPDGVTFSDVIRFTAERAIENRLLSYLIQGDFPAFAKAYVDLTDDEYALTSAIAYERYFALNWVCELSTSWEGIRIDL
ncbi:MAG: DUF4272 domain-containing protein [Anaerolineae bacterium]|nr:DUF4272 domain-containing protein [Anaerolineae bacterium]MDQ7034379.1 DUF4272 domain-containing protein [Anaerolineae bacterium]